MPIDQRLIKDFLGGDPIAGSQALHELVAQGDVAEQELLSRPVDYGGTVQVRRRWLRYVAMRESSLAPRLLDRLKGENEFGDAYSAAFLFAGLSKPREFTDELYTRIKADIDNHRPGNADAALMAYGHAGADGASIWHLINQNSYAWEKLSTFAFRSACAACARINTGSSWTLEQLITHRWDRNGFELEEIVNSPDAPVYRIAIDDSEMSLQANYTFKMWRRGEVADQVLRDWSRHSHWRVRSFASRILSSLGFLRTVSPIVEWLHTEQVPGIRAALLDALQRSESTAGADALLDTFETTGEGTQSFAKVGWRASDKKRALKALKAISAIDSSVGAEALVSLARLGFRHPELTQFLDSGDHYRRLNAMLALGYLGDQQDLRRLTLMQAEAANPTERVYVAASVALLGMPGAAMQLHRELIAAAEETDVDRRVDVFYMYRYLQNAVLGGLEAGGSETSVLLDSWRSELESLEPIPNAAKPLPIGAGSTGKKFDGVAAAVMVGSQPGSAPAAPHRAPSAAESSLGQSKTGQAGQGTNNGANAGGGNGANGAAAGNGDKDKELLEMLGKRAGIGGIAAGILLILYRTLVFPQLGAKQANLFMILIYGAVFAMFALWAYQLTKKVTIPLLLLVFGVVLGVLGRSMLRVDGDEPEVHHIRVRAIGPDHSALKRAKVSSTLEGEIKSVDGGWEIDIPVGLSEQKRQLTIDATVEDLGLTGSTTLTLSSDTVQVTTLELKKSGELPVRGIVEDSHGNSIPNALVSVLGFGKDAVLSDASGSFELPSHALADETIPLHAEKPGFTPANIPNFKVGSGAVTLTLGDPDEPGATPPGKRSAVPRKSTSSASASTAGSGQGAPKRNMDNAGSSVSPMSPQNPNSGSGQCESLQEFQGDESALATLAEKAFSRQSYDCTIAYLEQAKKVQSSGVWGRDYPLLAASYLLAKKDRSQFRAILQEMLGEMRRPGSYLHHGPTIGFVLANVTNVRFYVDQEGQNYLDQITAEAIKIRGSVPS
jgi:hypothetical protein